MGLAVSAITTLRVLTAFAILILTAAPGWAEVCHGRFYPYSFCPRCTSVSIKTTKRDTPCSVDINVGGGRIYVGSKIARRPSHGQAGVEGPSVAYVPAKGFVGTDKFTVEWDLLEREKALVIFVEYTIEVTP
ncbi:MAG: Ig-like domain-containing protein [Pseudomonadota bacterium]